MREPRRDLFGNELPSRWEDQIEDFMYTLPVWLQPWYALLFFAAIGVVFILVISILVYGLDGLT